MTTNRGSELVWVGVVLTVGTLGCSGRALSNGEEAPNEAHPPSLQGNAATGVNQQALNCRPIDFDHGAQFDAVRLPQDVEPWHMASDGSITYGHRLWSSQGQVTEIPISGIVVNAHGTVVGTYDSGALALFDGKGTTNLLPAAVNQSSVYGCAISDGGWVVGSALLKGDGDQRLFRWHDGMLDWFPYQSTYKEAAAIDDQGTALMLNYRHGGKWYADGRYEDAPVSGWWQDMNRAGEVVGWLQDDQAREIAVRWNPDGSVERDIFGAGWKRARAVAINNCGDVIGGVDNGPDEFGPYILSGGKIGNLSGLVAGAEDVVFNDGLDIADNGDILAMSYDSPGGYYVLRRRP
jgi:hypothetical protein